VRSVVEAASNIRLPFLTMYAFSAENWKRRPRAEVEFLMQLLRQYLKIEVPRMNRHNVRLQYIGRVHELPDSVQDRLKWAQDATASNTGTVMTLALNYGARTELVDAFQSIIRAAQNNGGVDHLTIDEELVSRHLYSSNMPDPDLVIRTSGEQRVSNFLLWQIAYAEIYVTEKLWPDFQGVDLLHAIADYQRRERRYGGLAPHSNGHGESARTKLMHHARRAHKAGKALLSR
jgi:undecaprenyl diphosphate synthase